MVEGVCTVSNPHEMIGDYGGHELALFPAFAT